MMDVDALNLLINIGLGVGANYTTTALTAGYRRVFGSRPDVEHRISHPQSAADLEAALAETAVLLEGLAKTENIQVDDALLTALRSARYDQQKGVIRIEGVAKPAEIPVTEIGGTIRVRAVEAETVTGVDIEAESGLVKFQPGTEIDVAAEKAKNVTGLKIGSRIKKD